VEDETVSETGLLLRPGTFTKKAVGISGGGTVLGCVHQELSGIDQDDEVRIVHDKPGAAEPDVAPDRRPSS
jgi:hypothetical protein